MLKCLGPSLAAIALANAAQAQDLRPAEALGIALGPVAGIAYYTVQPDGYRVVATLGDDGAATPVRVVATLAPSQAVTLSIPREVGAAPLEMVLTRRGDSVVVLDGARATN